MNRRYKYQKPKPFATPQEKKQPGEPLLMQLNVPLVKKLSGTVAVHCGIAEAGALPKMHFFALIGQAKGSKGASESAFAAPSAAEAEQRSPLTPLTEMYRSSCEPEHT